MSKRAFLRWVSTAILDVYRAVCNNLVVIYEIYWPSLTVYRLIAVRHGMSTDENE